MPRRDIDFGILARILLIGGVEMVEGARTREMNEHINSLEERIQQLTVEYNDKRRNCSNSVWVAARRCGNWHDNRKIYNKKANGDTKPCRLKQPGDMKQCFGRMLADTNSCSSYLLHSLSHTVCYPQTILRPALHP